jgi:Flp pilus assembly protein TadG
MFRRIGNLAKELLRERGGHAMMMLALGVPTLVGLMGYGIDTAQWYMWQRELQHSVDQAAIGGAWTLAYDENGDYKTRAEQEFNANQNLTASFASAPTIELANYDGGSANSVLVTATVTRQLPFTGMLLHRATTVAARAQAMFKEGSKYNACLITLKEDGTTFTIGGNAHVIANCGLGALSCSDNAITIDGSATVETTSIAACGTVDAPDELKDTISEGATGLSDAYADIPIPQPVAGTDDQTASKYCGGNGSKAIATLKPGKYTGGYVAKCNTTFAAGVYFIDGGTLDLSTNATVHRAKT